MSDTKKCPHCGKQIHSSAQYCMFCMTPLVSKQNITPQMKKSNKKIILGVTLLILVALLVVSLLVLYPHFCRRPQSPGENPPGSEGAVDTQLSPGTTVPSNIQPPSGTKPSPSQSEPPQTGSNTPPITGSNDQPVAGSNDQPAVEQPTAPPKPTCNHSYLAASCVAPMTCKDCGNTVGTADASAHAWKPVYSQVHYAEMGHYEDREVSYKKTVYLCFFCGYSQDGYDSLEALRNHMVAHANKSDYNFVVSRPDLLADTREVWATKTEQQWVIDQAAHDETLLTGYTCTLCGGQKGP